MYIPDSKESLMLTDHMKYVCQTCPGHLKHATQALLGAGADLLGKTHLDELAYSLNGENTHYGTPVNPACPDRIPGGSSSGSAVSHASFLLSYALCDSGAPLISHDRPSTWHMPMVAGINLHSS